MTRKWSLSGPLEDCCQPLTTIGKIQQCAGTNLATLLYHPHSGDQKPQLPPAAVKLRLWFQQITHKTEACPKTDFGFIQIYVHPSPL